jgi:hypothetical protein
MSLRVLLAVVLTAALLAASLPAIQSAQQARADQQVTATVDRIEAAITDLARHSDPVRPGVPGAVRRIPVEIPRRPAGVTLSLGPPAVARNGTETVLTASVPGEPDVVRRLDVPVRPAGADRPALTNGTLELGDSTTLTLEYRRVAGEPVVTVTRGFK